MELTFRVFEIVRLPEGIMTWASYYFRKKGFPISNAKCEDSSEPHRMVGCLLPSRIDPIEFTLSSLPLIFFKKMYILGSTT